LSFEGIVRLMFHTVSAAAVLFALWAPARLWVLRIKCRKGIPSPGRTTEAPLWVFVFYLFCLYQITVFRYGIRPELWAKKTSLLDGVNLTPLVYTLKLCGAHTMWPFVYNLLGNVVWFIPLGALLPVVLKRRRAFWFFLMMGTLCSLSIELLQYVFVTGVSDIDDIIFNTIGTAVGYQLYVAVSGRSQSVRCGPKVPITSSSR